MSLFKDAKTTSYRAIRAASNGASVSLVRSAGDYVAMFACATAIAAPLGDRALSVGDGIPEYRIPIEEIQSTCTKLQRRFSIALVEAGIVNYEVCFVLLWKIPAEAAKPVSENVDDY